MTQPPPYPGGYPPPPGSQGGFGQQPPPGGPPPPPPPGGGPPPPPGQFPGGPPPPPPGGGPPPPPGQFPGGPPSGFPPPGPPSPKKGGAGKVLGIVGAALLVLIGVGFFFVRGLSGDGSDAETADGGGDTQAAEVGDCTNEMAETNEFTDTDASDVVTVSCDSDDAFFEIVEREDNPANSDEEKVAEEACTGTMATDYIYQHRGSDLDWLICLDPIDIETAEWGAIPGDVGQCWSDHEAYFEIVACDDPGARYEVVFAEENPSTSATTADEASGELCPQEATAYWSDPQEAPFDWYVCGIAL